MPHRRFFVPGERIRGATASLPPDQSHHLLHVLRIRAGQEIEIFDGRGQAYAGIVEIRGSEVLAAGLTPVAAGVSRARSIVLAIALIRGEKLEWVIQKATELGVDAFVPLETRRCTTRIPEARRAARATRWRTIAAEAAKQCHRDSVPTIHEISDFKHFVCDDPFPGFSRFLCYEGSANTWNQELLRPPHALVCVGPEGGWEPAEVHLAASAGFHDFSLGERTLRSETAALAALTLFLLSLDGSGVHVEG